jgi:hypothetical protein
MQMYYRVGRVENAIGIIFPNPCMQKPEAEASIPFPDIGAAGKTFRCLVGFQIDGNGIFNGHQFHLPFSISIIDKYLRLFDVKHDVGQGGLHVMETHMFNDNVDVSIPIGNGVLDVLVASSGGLNVR